MQNLFVIVFTIFVVLFHNIDEISTQAIVPIGYGSSPMMYSQNDDDLGMLLTILLLAGRNRNCNGRHGQTCNCCNCCNCGENSQSIPIPYPIPFPTNNPIVNRRDQFYDESSDDDDDDEDEHDRDKYSESSANSIKEEKSKVIRPEHISGADNSVTIVHEVEEEVKTDSKPKNY